LLAAALLASALIPARPAHAASFTVTTTADTADAWVGDGVCADVHGRCTLRAAVQEANARPGADIITLPAGTYTLSFVPLNGSGDLNLTGETTIMAAPGATATIRGGHSWLDRIFAVAPSANVKLVDLIIAGGIATRGGAIFNEGTLLVERTTIRSSGAEDGGAIFNRGALTLSGSTLRDNIALFSGGAIFNHAAGTLSISSSTLAGNRAGSDGGGLAFAGGEATIQNSTFSGNQAGAGGALAAGLATSSRARLTIRNTTITGNEADLGGGVYHERGSVRLVATILAGNQAVTGDDCYGAPVSLGYTLLGSARRCDLVAGTGDLVGADPLLGSLAENGGPTRTHAIRRGSPAADALPPTADLCPPVDQRGTNRPLGAACDIGAYERDATPPAVAAIEPISPNPRNTPVAAVTIRFSEPISPTTFTSSDLVLVARGGEVRLDSSVTIARVGPSEYRISGLAAFTRADGDYGLAVNAAGVEDLDGNPGVGIVATSWLMDATGPVVLSVGPVTPDPRREPLAALDVRFSEPISPTTFTHEDLTLTRDGQPVALSEQVQIASVTGALFRVEGLAPFTSEDGVYALTVLSPGVRDLLGNQGPVGGSASVSWRMAGEIPRIVRVGPVTPSSRNTPVATVDVALSEPVRPDGMTRERLLLTRDGVPILLDEDVALTAVGEVVYRIDGLAGYTGAEGVYTLTVSAEGLIDIDNGNSGEGSAAATWVVDRTAPIAGSVSAPVEGIAGSAWLTFSVTYADRVGVDPASLGRGEIRVRRQSGFDGTGELMSVTGMTNMTAVYRVAAPGGAWGPEDSGTYSIELLAGQVRDMAGNVMPGGELGRFTIDIAPEASPVPSPTPEPAPAPAPAPVQTIFLPAVWG
jgi:CSLREA domain-containing protein